jgi:hypothetical protein
MPSKITFIKYLCDYCTRLYEDEYTCAVHERNHTPDEILHERHRRMAMVKPIFLSNEEIAAHAIARQKILTTGVTTNLAQDYDDDYDTRVTTNEPSMVMRPRVDNGGVRKGGGGSARFRT